MAINSDPLYVLNILLGFAIVVVGFAVYWSNRNKVALFIAVAYIFNCLSNVLLLFNLKEPAGAYFFFIRIMGYLTIILGLYIGWKLARTQIEALREKNRQLEAEIAERKRHQELREQAEEKYHIVFDNALVAMSIVEEDLLISFSNRECEKIMGYTREEVVGKMRITDFLDPRDLEMVVRYGQLRKTDPASAPDRYEVRLIDGKGAVKNILLNIAIIPGTGKMVVSFLDMTERRQAEDRIKTSLREKEVLLKEIHHRVKNNLQIVSSLLNLQSGKLVDRRDLDLFRESQSRVKSMALIHEKLYLSGDLSHISLRDYVDSIIENLNTTYGVRSDIVKTTVDVRDLYIDLDRGIPCGLIINELATNCYKHAFPEGRKGEVRICMRMEAENYVLTVSDNGRGLPNGLDVDKLASLGMQLVSSLTIQLKGSMEIETAGSGTTFEIVFPK